MRKLAGGLLLLLTLPLFAADEQPLGTQFAVAIEDHDLDAVKALVEGKSAPVDTPIDYGDNAITPLMKAAWDGDRPIVEYLLSKGANVNFRSKEDGGTALLNAVTQGDVEIVRALLAAKANVAARNKYDFNAFTSAVAAGKREIAEALLEAGAKPNEEVSGLTPLAFAASSGDVEMMRFLVAHGADVNHRSASGQTALISAILAAKIESVRTLIELKADVNAKMKDGDTPLKLAQKGDQDDVVALLKAAGAKK